MRTKLRDSKKQSAIREKLESPEFQLLREKVHKIRDYNLKRHRTYNAETGPELRKLKRTQR